MDDTPNDGIQPSFSDLETCLGQEADRIVIYARDSHRGRFADTNSAFQQIALCRVWADRVRRGEIVEIFKDEASLARHGVLPGLVHCLATIRSGRANRVLVSDMSRLTRDVSHAVQILRFLEMYESRLLIVDVGIVDLHLACSLHAANDSSIQYLKSAGRVTAHRMKK